MTDLKQAAQQALEALKGLFGTPENWESGGVAVWKLGGSDAPRKAIAALEATLEQAEPVQKPVPQAESVGEVVEVNNDGFRSEFSQRLAVGTKLYTFPPAAQRKPLTDDVLVPLEVLEAAANSLDSFCGDLGWGDADLQNMDNLFSVIEQHKAAHNKQVDNALRIAIEAAWDKLDDKPVACRFCHSEKGCWTWQCYNCGEIDDVQKPTVQPKKEPRQWVVLEAEDLAQIESDDFWQIGNHMAIAMAVEAKLKELNK